jgi:PAS domain S-box-containing protein
MGARLRAHDWTSSPLGAPGTWPQTLCSVVSLLLNARQAMFVAWGPDLTFLYNDDYAPILGTKHPAALGRPFAQVWSDIWDQIGPLVERTLAGDPSWHEDLLIPMLRHGYPEEAWFSFSYTPLRDDDGAVTGLFCAVVETTAKVLAERRCAAENARLQQMFQQAPGMMVLLRGPDHVFELVNPTYLTLIGRREVIGKPVREALPELAGQGFVELLDEVYRTGKAFTATAMRVRVRRRDGAEERFINFVYQPLTDTEGHVTGIFVEGFEVTGFKRAEAALRAAHDRNVEILESISDAFYAVDAQWRFTYINRKTEEWWQRGREDLIGKVFWEEFPQAVGSEPYKAHLAAMQHRQPVRLEAMSPVLHHWVDISIYPTRDGGLSVYFRDITDRRRADEQRELLINELNHRVKNTLATVQSIAAQTLRNAPTAQAAKDALEGRLIALARAHDVLTRENWEGASLQEIVAQAVEPFSSGGEDRLHLSGPAVRLPPRMALALAMALQELATNAVKYGALSNAAGEIRITWTHDAGSSPSRLQLRWQESGGPPVATPTRRGFGSRLIERSLAQDLDGTAHMQFEPGGLVCTLDAPLEE